MDWHENHQTAVECFGGALLVLASVVGRQPWGIFVGQCALAVSLAGQVMIYLVLRGWAGASAWHDRCGLRRLGGVALRRIPQLPVTADHLLCRPANHAFLDLR
ncbi:MAG: hypothetical protein WDO13_00825 [Verrucomicrobiota bacterium]